MAKLYFNDFYDTCIVPHEGSNSAVLVEGCDFSSEDIIRIAEFHREKHKYDPHIIFGIDNSFQIPEAHIGFDYNIIDRWESLFEDIMKEDYWITLEFDPKYVNVVHEMNVSDYQRFIPIVNVKIPYIQALGYNACVKIDSDNWGEENPGIWLHRAHSLVDPKNFHEWQHVYDKDSWAEDKGTKFDEIEDFPGIEKYIEIEREKEKAKALPRTSFAGMKESDEEDKTD